MENIVFPIFGEERFEDMYDVDALDNEDLQAMAQRTGIKSAILYGLVQIGTTEIYIYDVTVSDRVMMRRNRVGIQQLIRKIMETYTSAFIIFHYEDSESWDWRFSFCQKDDKEVTEAKRYTFLLGPDQSCRTAAENFQKLINKHGDINRDDIVQAFDVAALSDEFFGKYKAQYEKFCNYIYDNCEDESLFGYEFAEWDEKLIRDYVKKLLGRIVFLHFLQKKGWLGVPLDGEWGDGDKQFMKHLFEASSQKQKDNYLDCVLEPLFAEALNTLRTDDIFDLKVKGFRNIRIPYLNGGLFERDMLDEPKSTFPASYFDDLFEFFYQYNFTIDENDPNDAEVGIDPEMLGRIFENLLEDNKDKGAFYTPKEIVQYMCRESLIAYLTTCVMKKQGENHKTEDEIKESVRQLLNKPEDIVPRMNKKHLEDFDSYIRNVKICDPAIGSGAFPMGLLNELVRCRVFINAWAKDEKGNLLEGDYAALKTEIISNNIYGVDIEKGAIDIARLRFWLSIIVDEQTPHVLPNFDYKFMQGNSLIPTFDGKFINLDTTSQSHINVVAMKKEKQHLYELKQKYYKAEGEDKHELNVQIKDTILKLISRQLGYESRAWYLHNAVQTTLDFGEVSSMSFDKVRQSLPADKLESIELAETLHAKLNDKSIPVTERSQIDIHFFDWRIMFTEVFDNGSDGFDIVIGNPPYIDSETMSKKMALLREIYNNNYECARGNWDIFVVFVELGIKLLNKDGIFCNIIPNKLIAAKYAVAIRTRIAETTLIEIRDYSKVDVFVNAAVYPITILLRKDITPVTSTFAIMDDIIKVNQINRINSIELSDNEYWDMFFVDKASFDIVSKINIHARMNSLPITILGAATVADAYQIKNMVKEQDGDDDGFKLINSGTIDPFTSLWGLRCCRYIKNSYLRPIVPFSELQEYSEVRYVQSKSSKIVVASMTTRFEACLDIEGKFIAGKSTTIILGDINILYFLIAIINSKLASFWLNIVFNSLKMSGGAINIGKNELSRLPIPPIDEQISEKIKTITNKETQSGSIECVIKEIDQLVYQLYGLTDEEIAIVEGNNE